jgi:hypothetical protein
MLKMRHATEVLPVRVLNPSGDHVFIAQIMLVLQIVKSHHQTRGDAGRALGRVIGAAQRLIDNKSMP